MEIPKEVQDVVKKLNKAGFEAYIVGGCVRDLLLGEKPKDWDIATNAKPEEIQKLFPKSFYENQFFTVGVLTESADSALKVVEVTTFRSEDKYTDKRHPDEVKPAKTIEEDLARRDFTINAIALNVLKSDFKTIDPFGGQKDVKDKIVRAVGEPQERFAEDALRTMRAVRFAASLGKGWKIEEETALAIQKNASLLRVISKERIRDELEKIIMSDRAADGITLLRTLGLLKYILPELEEGWDVGQNKHHKYTVWEHNILSLQYAAEKGYSFEVRMASLLHDVGKPRSKRGEGPNCTFYGHEVIGARMTAKMLERLRFPKHTIEKIALLVRAHMFNYDPEVVTDASVRRLVAKVGSENIKELVQVREADRIGSGVPKAVPYRLRHFMFRVEKVLQKPVSRNVMKFDGNELMKLAGISPGPRVGAILDLLFEEILDDPKRNTKKYLELRTKELHKLSDKELLELRKRAQIAYQNILKGEEEKIKRKYYVK